MSDIPATLPTKIFMRFVTPPLILPDLAICRFARYHRNSLQTTPADSLLRTESFLQQFYYPFSHCRCKHFLAMFLLPMPTCFPLGKLHAIATTSGVAITLYLPTSSAFIYSDSLRHCFSTYRYLQYHGKSHIFVPWLYICSSATFFSLDG